MKILAISGSLRKESLNTAVLKTLKSRAPKSVSIEITSLEEIPLYNADIDTDPPLKAVGNFKKAIEEADAIIIATPEYNYSVPGVLKNAIDWASRPAFNSVLKNKVVGIVSVSMAPTGGVRAQQHLKTILSGTLSRVVLLPETMVAGAHNLVENGLINDEHTLAHLDRFLETVMADIN